LSSVNDTAQLNSDLVALAWCTLLANQRLVDVWNDTYNRSDIYALIHINTDNTQNTKIAQTVQYCGWDLDFWQKLSAFEVHQSLSRLCSHSAFQPF